MNVIVCLDDQNGMMFNHRRQSRDQEVIKDIISTCQEKSLYVSEYSYSLFKNLVEDNIIVQSEPLAKAEMGSYCFIEEYQLLPYESQIEKLIIYKWNRKYPTDMRLDLQLEDTWQKISSCDFKGFSHEKVTKEIYTR